MDRAHDTRRTPGFFCFACVALVAMSSLGPRSYFALVIVVIVILAIVAVVGFLDTSLLAKRAVIAKRKALEAARRHVASLGDTARAGGEGGSARVAPQDAVPPT